MPTSNSHLDPRQLWEVTDEFEACLAWLSRVLDLAFAEADGIDDGLVRGAALSRGFSGSVIIELERAEVAIDEALQVQTELKCDASKLMTGALKELAALLGSATWLATALEAGDDLDYASEPGGVGLARAFTGRLLNTLDLARRAAVEARRDYRRIREADAVSRPPTAVSHPRQRPGRSCRLIVRNAAWLLPAPQRARYDNEWCAELWDVPRCRRLLYALSLLAKVPEMRRALTFVPADELERRDPWERG